MKKFIKRGLICAFPLPILFASTGMPEWLTAASGVVLILFGVGALGMSYLPGVHVSTNTSPNRSVNTAYDSDPQFWMSVNYTIVTSVTNPLAAGTSSATASLQTSNDGGTTWVTINQVGQSSGVGLAVLVAYISGGTFILTGLVPPAVKYKITTSGAGTFSVSAPTGNQQELTFG